MTTINFKEEYLNKIANVAKVFHDRACISSLTMNDQICGCCRSLVFNTTSIEHDSLDYSQDLSVCSNCYQYIVTWWKSNAPHKIGFI